MDNKFFRYSRYAIGEIVLVVVGILIALQINNWNEDRKEKALYLTYLHRLRSDSENMLDNIRITKQVGKHMEELTKYQLDFLNGKLMNIDTFKLAVTIEFTAGIISYSLDMPVYSELKSTGRLVLIESDSLKTELADLEQYSFQRQKDHSEWEPWVFKYRDLVRNVLIAEDRVRINDLWAALGDTTFISNWSKAYTKINASGEFSLKTDMKKITNDLLNIEYLPGLVSDIYMARSFTQAFLEKEESNTLNLIHIIDSEIERVKD